MTPPSEFLNDLIKCNTRPGDCAADFQRGPEAGTGCRPPNLAYRACVRRRSRFQTKCAEQVGVAGGEDGPSAFEPGLTLFNHRKAVVEFAEVVHFTVDPAYLGVNIDQHFNEVHRRLLSKNGAAT